ncbi:MAG: cupin domain-containing protein [Planctomycetaceae bacterium]
MPVANWTTQVYNVVQSLLYNNPHRVVEFRVRDEQGRPHNRAEVPAPTRRLYETEAPPERTCLRTIQFVHHVLIPPGGRHVVELHVHPDAEELVIVTRGRGTATIDGETTDIRPEDVVYVPPAAEHEFRNSGDDLLGLFFINVPTGEGLRKLIEAQPPAEG